MVALGGCPSKDPKDVKSIKLAHCHNSGLLRYISLCAMCCSRFHLGIGRLSLARVWPRFKGLGAEPYHCMTLYHMGIVGAVEAYMGWAPLAQMQSSGLLRACSFLLTTSDFRMASVDILAVAGARKQQQVHSADVALCRSERCVCWVSAKNWSGRLGGPRHYRYSFISTVAQSKEYRKTTCLCRPTCDM